MDIGSAKVTKEEMDGVKHYLIDVLEPTDEFNIYVFKKLALEALNEIYENGKIGNYRNTKFHEDYLSRQKD